MASLAEVIRKQRSSGSGAAGSLFSAIGKKTLEKIDPRRMFNQQGIITALFPSLKAYKAGGSTGKSDVNQVSSLSMSASPLLQEMIVKLDTLSTTSKIVAKNSQTLPGMSRDMNIMRQNIIKLVKLQGGKASTSADGFFLRSFERERATEAQLQAAKERRSTGKATALTATKEGLSSMPGLGMLMGLATSIYAVGKKLISGISSLGEMLGPLLKGGLSLLLDFGKGAANLAVKGGQSLFDLAKKIPFTKILRGLLNFISGAGGIALLGVGGAAAALNYLLSHDKTEYGDTSQHTPGQMPSVDSSGQFADPGALGSSELDAARPSTQEERVRAREAMRNSSDPNVRRSAAELDRSDPLSRSPTPISLSGFEKMAVDMIKKHEGLPKNGKAYKDAHGHSIGYGHFITPAEKERGYIIAGDEQIPIDQNNILNTSITKEQAEKLLAQDLPKYIQAAKVPLGEAWEKLNDYQKAALVSSAYNTGQGGIQHLVKKGLKDAIMQGDFKKAGEIIKEHGFKTAVMDGKRQTVSGLVSRRAEEGAIMASTSTLGGQLVSASSENNDIKNQSSAQQPVIVNAPTNNNVQQSGGGGGVATASPFEGDILLGLFRTAGI